MAGETRPLNDVLADLDPTAVFEPYAYYGSEEDAVTIYWSGEPDYSRRLNSRVTVFHSLNDDELVGCRIKSVQHVLEDLGWFDVRLRHGKLKVDLLFATVHSTFSEDPVCRDLYRRMGEAIRNSRIDEVELSTSEA